MGVFDRQFFKGLAFIALLAAVVAGAVAMYRGDFTSTDTITVVSDRAGLTMEVGSPVKVRGVEVGKISSIETNGETVRIHAAIAKDKLGAIPADVSAELVPPTAFGSKYIQLTAGKNATAARMRPGDVIHADRVTVEINEAFTNLTQVLDAARPADVNNALTAVATAVDNRGDQLGNLVTRLDEYLTSFNPSIKTLASDLHKARGVAETYDKAADDLLSAADKATVPSATLTNQEASLQAFLANLNSATTQTDTLLRNTRKNLTTSLDLLDPVTAVLSRYSSELGCLVPGVVRLNQLAEKAVGGGQFPGITTFTGIQHQHTPYKYPQNLPQVHDASAPNCYGLPLVSNAEAAKPNPVFDTGANPYAADKENGPDNLSNTFFGVLAGLVNFG